MKVYLFILLCLFVSIYSQNCSKVQDVTDENSCFFKDVLNENNTCCYVEVGENKYCIEVDFEGFDNSSTKIESIEKALSAEEISGTLGNYSCDSDHRNPNLQTNKKNYLYVGLLTLLSLLF